MRRSIWMRILAVLLIVSMLATPVSAAGGRGGRGNRDGSRGDRWPGNTESTEATEATEPEATEGNSDAELVLVEDASTVDNGELLRASTYALTAASDDVAVVDDTGTTSTTTVKYFPVTMYNYDGATINAATDALDDDLTVREGLYFSNGGTELGSYTMSSEVDLSAFVAGQYYIQNIRASENSVGSWLYSVADDGSIRGTTDQSAATLWTLVVEDGEYYLMSGDKYLVVGTDGDTDGLTETKTPITISAYSGNSSGVQLSQSGYYLCQWGSATSVYYGGYNVSNDGGNGMLFYAVTDGVVSTTPTAPVAGESYMTAGYQAWNWWGYLSSGHSSQNKAYTGLVQKSLINDQIVFNVNEGGIFDANADVKDIYTYVGLPFVLNTETGVYSFDSDDNGVYFADTDGDGDSDPQSGTAQAPYNMYFDAGNTQGWATDGGNLGYGDGSSNLWAPFNTTENDTGASSIDYHFGMRADLPFSMTPNGRVKSTDDESAPITFSFKGDDDVWVFIDGHLVIDLGGIHNRLGATIDFAANTITYFKPDTNNKDLPIGSHNDPDFAITQKLFTDSEGTGIINMTRDAFAAVEDHEMEVFYLERGKGTSNCQIEFNLPMNDTVLVTKDATKSWSQAAEDADLAEDPNAEDPGVDNLTAAEQAVVDAMNFGFTLYKKGAEDTEYAPVANTNFYLLNAAGERIAINSTDANGKFYLKNGQTAKFITEIPAEGVSYYVVEDTVPDGFVTPDYNFAGVAVNGFDYVNAAGETVHVAQGNLIPEQIIDTDAAENKSYEVTVAGSIEANDSVQFICSNYMDATLPNPSIFVQEDIIVIDYGLPVQIDPLANDLFRANNQEIVYIGGDNVTYSESTVNGVVYWDGFTSDALHSGSVQLVKGTPETDDNSRDTLVYTLSKQLTEVEVLNYVVRVDDATTTAGQSVLTQNAYAVGKIYIVPATQMYYEENFSDMVTFKGANWVGEVTTAGASDYQEPGVVGTIGDSTYGSDVAYLSDSYDSNGTSYYGDTSGEASGSNTVGAIQFTYTFTGTGSSFFARTSATTGYMQVKLYEGTDTTGTYKNVTYRDTYYKDENATEEDASGTLYNIPVYYTGELDYGTYTVVATVAKAGTKTDGNVNGSGKDFYLDGIRVMQPLNESNETVINEETGETITDKALGAYATDGESNIDVVTLRYKMITDAELGTTPWNFVVLTDINGEIKTVESYESIGPKEEVYLNEGQTVSFGVKYWHQDGYMLYMGMKAPFGNAQVQVGKTTYDLANAADCYYAITGDYSSVVTKYEQAMDEDGNLLYTDADGNEVYEDANGDLWYVSGGSAVPEDADLTPVDDLSQPYFLATYTFTSLDKIVSLTNIKAVGNYEFVLVEDINIDVNGDENIE